MMKTLTSQDFDYTHAIEVVSSAIKFIGTVMLCPGEPLIYPPESGRDGWITDWSGKPVGEEGVVFFNAKDMSFQAVESDGRGVVIINEVTQTQYESLMRVAKQIGGDPHHWETSKVKEFLIAARELGCTDMYNSSVEFVQTRMRPIDSVKHPGIVFGLHQRIDREPCLALHVSGPAQFQGPAATEQKIPDEGAVLVKQGESLRIVQTDVFLRTYRHVDGSEIARVDLTTSDSQS